MPRRWENFRDPWDREYAMRGSLWRGVSDASYLRAWAPEGARVLELGCGDGKFLEGLAQAGFGPIGLDRSRNALRLARARGGFAFARGDLRALPFRAASFPLVAARYALGALAAAGRKAAAGEIERVLAPQGVLLVEEFGRGDFRHGTGREVEAGTFERNRGVLTHYFEPAEVPALFLTCHVLRDESLDSVQRIQGKNARRHRQRWILRRQASAPKDSIRDSAPARS